MSQDIVQLQPCAPKTEMKLLQRFSNHVTRYSAATALCSKNRDEVIAKIFQIMSQDIVQLQPCAPKTEMKLLQRFFKSGHKI